MNGNAAPGAAPSGFPSGPTRPAVSSLPRAVLFFQAIRGPVLLITIGVLFAVHQAGILPFSRTWPLIIIVIGLMKLFERMAAPHRAVAPGGPY